VAVWPAEAPDGFQIMVVAAEFEQGTIPAGRQVPGWMAREVKQPDSGVYLTALELLKKQRNVFTQAQAFLNTFP